MIIIRSLGEVGHSRMIGWLDDWVERFKNSSIGFGFFFKMRLPLSLILIKIFFKDLFYVFLFYVCFACIYVFIPNAWCPQRSEHGLDFLDLEL